ncbi:MAG: Uma2 family endonuclease [Jaaginema sp. PMC 1079.18]|nr:Uma2 family endonuclease [Jaaginema sp. PMC 1080.18]MEC4852448.1 Uma2 family endonuclease [Jaaginema sp. PMC 1079.18]MEC4864533.1 Uma2 family endonuclease [Jaaginema sp. PMC 1078.18]
MTSILTSQNYTIDEYLAQEVQSPERHEYYKGKIHKMTGGTPNHNQIAGNLYAHLNFALKRQPYSVFVTDQRLWIPSSEIYAYPDVMVIRQPLEMQTGRKDVVMNPLMISEVLSISTRSYDKDQKFLAYRTIPSFREYLIIEQTTVLVEHYTKTEDGVWLLRDYENLDATVKFNTVNFAITLADLYDKVNFETAKS